MNMEQSKLTEALAKVQANLPKIDKNKTAKVPTKSGGEYSYKYADLADVAEKIHPLLAANGLAWLTKPTYDEHGRFVLRYQLRHEAGEVEAGDYPLVNLDSATPQVVGSAITYARRYALCCVTGAVPDEDNDAQHVGSSGRSQPAKTNQRQAQPKPIARKVDTETGEVLAPVADPLDGLDPVIAEQVRKKMQEANFPAVLSPAARRTVDKWITEAKAQTEKEAPFT